MPSIYFTAFILTCTLTLVSCNNKLDSRPISPLPADHTKPVIKLNGDSIVTIEVFDQYVEQSASATDDIDGELSVTLYGEVDTNKIGRYQIAYRASDSSGNYANITRFVDVVDTSAPVITLNGIDNIVLEAKLNDYFDLGASVTDNYDSVYAQKTGTVDTQTIGVYTLTYNASDSSGNHALPVTRTVNIVDTQKPVITLNNNTQLSVLINEEYTPPNAIAFDEYSGLLNIQIEGEVDTNKLGTYTLTYSAVDAAGNRETVTHTVEVVDNLKPVITLIGESVLNLEIGDTYSEQGAVVTDNYDQTLSVDITGEVQTDERNISIISYNAIDSSGNQAMTLERSVLVGDYTAPVITLNGESNITLIVGEEYEELSAVAIDNFDGELPITISSEVDTQIAGKTIVTYSATDSSNQTSEIIRVINVVNAPFITTWKTDNEGVSSDKQITLEANLEDFPNGYNYNIEWGDGLTSLNVTGDITHTYSQAGIYQVSITGDYPQIYFASSSSDADKLLSVDQWGSNQWLSMKNAFYDSASMVLNASDIPNLSSVTDMSSMFASTGSFNQDISNWDVSSVKNMRSMFANTTLFNQPLNPWDVSSVTNMDGMFASSDKFDQSLDNWNVSSVTSMAGMFSNNQTFNQPIGAWDVSAVTIMDSMFYNNLAFNQPLNTWDVSSVVNMIAMFLGSQAFSQSLDEWDVSSVQYTNEMFTRSTFNSPIDNWNLESIIDLNGMFSYTTEFNQDLNNWNVSSVVTMERVFKGATSFNRDLSDWDVSSVTSMAFMFEGATSFNQNLNNWDTSSLSVAFFIFKDAESFDQSLAGWNIDLLHSLNILDNAEISPENYDATLIAWSNNPSNNSVSFNAGLSQYTQGSAADEARQNLIDNYGWFINDGGALAHPPVITLTGSSEITIDQFSTYVEPGVSATDVVDGDIIVTFNEIDTQTAGVYTITYSAVNSINIETTATRTITVLDKQPPFVTLSDGLETSIVIGQQFIESQISATDNVDTQFIISSSNDVETEVIGNYTATYLVSDQSGNQTTIVQSVEVKADVAPQIIIISNLEGHHAGSELIISAIDEKDGEVTYEITGDYDLNIPGVYEITITATDSLNQTTQITQSLTVVGTAFITTWKTDNDGLSNDNQITLSTNLEDFPNGYNYNIEWGDGLTSLNVTGDITHTYSQAGIYQVSITGDYPQIYFANSSSDADKLLSVDQWGSNQWLSMKKAFYDSASMVLNTSDIPNLSSVTDMSSMFASTDSFNQDISNWDVSSVKNMSGMFSNTTLFNQPLNPWDVSSVTNMTAMFASTLAFNQNLDNWDVSAVTNMEYMFVEAKGFNANIGNWDVSKVENMFSMFQVAINFNHDIGMWNTSSLTNSAFMFAGATRFNQNINNWDTSNIFTMKSMFEKATNFNQPLNDWDTSQVTDLSSMFLQATNFDQPLNNWDVSSVTNMNLLFMDAGNFNQDLNDWDVSSAISMAQMFYNATEFNGDISSWDVSNSTTFNGLFLSAINFNQDISQWDTASATDMNLMFTQAESFDQDLSGWDISSVSNDMYAMFAEITLSTQYYDAMLIAWSNQIPNENITFHGGFSQYTPNSPAQTARSILIDTFGWTITDGGPSVVAP